MGGTSPIDPSPQLAVWAPPDTPICSCLGVQLAPEAGGQQGGVSAGLQLSSSGEHCEVPDLAGTKETETRAAPHSQQFWEAGEPQQGFCSHTGCGPLPGTPGPLSARMSFPGAAADLWTVACTLFRPPMPQPGPQDTAPNKPT